MLLTKVMGWILSYELSSLVEYRDKHGNPLEVRNIN